MKIKVYASALFARAEMTGEYLLGVYDDTYPTEIYRGRVVGTAGGLAGPEDKSPEETLIRETREEFSINQDYSVGIDPVISRVIGNGEGPRRITRFADERLIIDIREALLGNATSFKDYLVHVPSLKQGRDPLDMILSTYSSIVPQELFEEVREALKKGEHVRNEGLVNIFDLRSLMEGRVLPAWATGIIIGDLNNVTLPNPEGVRASAMGFPRESYTDYPEFE